MTVGVHSLSAWVGPVRDEQSLRLVEREFTRARNIPSPRYELHVELSPQVEYGEYVPVTGKSGAGEVVFGKTAAGKTSAPPVDRQRDRQKLPRDITRGLALAVDKSVMRGRVRAPAVRDIYDISTAMRGFGPVLDRRGSREKEKKPLGIMDAFVRVSRRWELGRGEQAQLLGFPPGDAIAGELLSGGLGASSQDIRERVGYVVGISMGLSGLFGGVLEAELSWLRQACPSLDGKSPIRHMLQRRMINLIEVSELLKRERGL